ncbi:MAG: hypothetical protein SOT20_01050 [Candidatus Cryptobacteroides sp.]|nr:hypothetical protein [Candidatus Cryptobacteroides sp.]
MFFLFFANEGIGARIISAANAMETNTLIEYFIFMNLSDVALPVRHCNLLFLSQNYLMPKEYYYTDYG